MRFAASTPACPEDALDDALRKLTQPAGAALEARNRSFHRMLVDGVAVEYRAAGGAIRGAQVRVIDFDEPEANTWTAINQFTVTESGNTRRPDIVVFVNDLPLAVIELKNPADENATIWSAFQQLQTYKAELPSLFACNAVLAVSDGMQARVGTLSAGREWFKPWRTIDGQELAPAFYTELEVAIEGVFEKRRFLSLLRHFIVFEDDGGALVKKMAGYQPVPRGGGGGRRDSSRGGGCSRKRGASPKRAAGTRRADSRAATPATAGSASSGTPRVRGRA